MEEKLIEEKLTSLRSYATDNMIPILRPDTAKLLQKKVREKAPQKILEIGTAVGYSGILILSVCDGELVTIEKDEESHRQAVENFRQVGFEGRVKTILGDAKDILPDLEENTFDFIFLDGAKGQYVRYLPYLLKLLKKDGIMFSDNVLYRGMVDGKIPVKKNKRTLVRNLRLFLNEIENNKNLESCVLDIEDGISICKKIKE